jgi:hypothetical protein
MSDTNWGLVATIKAETADIETFVAHHLAQGAKAIYIYLDDANPDQAAALEHPKIRVTLTDDVYWSKRGGRPDDIEARQFKNARHAVNHASKPRSSITWFAHIDVDEFIQPRRGTVTDALATLDDTTWVARMRPVENLVTETGYSEYYKATPLTEPERANFSAQVFPEFGPFLHGGFISHLAGKVMFRLDLGKAIIRLHNVKIDGIDNPNQIEFEAVDLLHFHAKPWERFLALYKERQARGSYRAAIAPKTRPKSRPRLFELMDMIEAEHGIDGIRTLHSEVCTAHPDLIKRLDAHHMLRRYNIYFAILRSAYFG